MSPSDDAPDEEENPEAKCCGDHEREYGAGRPCRVIGWRCILRKVIDRWLEKEK